MEWKRRKGIGVNVEKRRKNLSSTFMQVRRMNVYNFLRFDLTASVTTVTNDVITGKFIVS